MADVELMRRAGAKMANTMINLAQQVGDVVGITAKMAVDFKEMQREWDEAVRTPSSSHPAEGERQSIDDGEFQRLEVAYVRALHACEDDLSASTANAASNARATLIAHIDTWAGRQREQGYADQLPRIRHLEHERDMALQAARSAGDAVPAGWKLVPESPTNEMVVAIERTVDDQLNASAMSPADMFRQDGATIYEAAIAAAPAPANTAPAVQPEGHDDDYDDNDYEEPCPNCKGDGRDPMNDYLLPCHLCQGQQP
jgi:hypothetical protein